METRRAKFDRLFCWAFLLFPEFGCSESILWSSVFLSFFADEKSISFTFECGTSVTWVGRIHVQLVWVHASFSWILVPASIKNSTPATSELDSARPALQLKRDFKSRTGLNLFRPYFHYCSSSVHYWEDRFHIHIFICMKFHGWDGHQHGGP